MVVLAPSEVQGTKWKKNTRLSITRRVLSTINGQRSCAARRDDKESCRYCHLGSLAISLAVQVMRDSTRQARDHIDCNFVCGCFQNLAEFYPVTGSTLVWLNLGVVHITILLVRCSLLWLVSSSVVLSGKLVVYLTELWTVGLPVSKQIDWWNGNWQDGWWWTKRPTPQDGTGFPVFRFLVLMSSLKEGVLQ